MPMMAHDNSPSIGMDWDAFVLAHADLASRVHVGTPWSIVHDDTVPIKPFGGPPTTR